MLIVKQGDIKYHFFGENKILRAKYKTARPEKRQSEVERLFLKFASNAIRKHKKTTEEIIDKISNLYILWWKNSIHFYKKN